MLGSIAAGDARPSLASTDSDLLMDHLRRASLGDQSALRDIRLSTHAKLFSVGMRLLNDRHACEDILQEAYLSIWLHSGKYDPELASPITWMKSIVRHRAIDHLRVNKVARHSIDLDELADVRCPRLLASEILEMKDLLGLVSDRLRAGRPIALAALRMSLVDGLTYRVIAQKLNVPEGTLKGIIRRSLASIRAALAASVVPQTGTQSCTASGTQDAFARSDSVGAL